jgi:nicotinamidase-related amidase
MTHVARSTPYPWPWDGHLEPHRIALVVTGWDAGWSSAVVERETALANIDRLAAAVHLTVTITHRPGPRRPVPVGPPPTVAAITPERSEHLDAAGIDGFYGSALDITLRRHGVDRLLLAGLGLETTVHSTMRSANDAGLECLAVVDACAPLDPGLVANAVSMIEMSGGIFGAVGATDDVLDALRTPTTGATPAATIATEATL